METNELLLNLQDIVDNLSEENYDSSIVSIKDIFDHLPRDSRTLDRVNEIFGEDPVIYNNLKIYFNGTNSAFTRFDGYLRHSLNMLNKGEIPEQNSKLMDDTNQKTVDLNFETLPNGEKAAVLTITKDRLGDEVSSDLESIMKGGEMTPKLKEVSITIQKIIDDKDALNPDNFSLSNLKIYNSYLKNFCGECECGGNCEEPIKEIEEKENPIIDDGEYPIIDTSIEDEDSSQFSDYLNSMRDCFAEMSCEQASFALSKIGASTRPEVSDALFAELFKDTDETCKNFSKTSIVYATEIGKAGEVIESMFSEDGIDENFSEVEQELYSRYINNFSYIMRNMSINNFSEIRENILNNFSDTELVELLNYSDEELIGEGIEPDTVEVISSIRDELCQAIPEEASEEEYPEEDEAEEAFSAYMENFADKSKVVEAIANTYRRVKNAVMNLPSNLRGLKKDYGYLRSSSPDLSRMGGLKQAWAKDATRAQQLKDAAILGTGALATAGAGYGAYRLMNHSDAEAAQPEVLPPEVAQQEVAQLAQKLAQADLSKEEASKVLVDVEDKVSPELAEAIQADVMQNIDARFSDVLDEVEVTPDEIQAADQVIDQAIQEIQAEKAGQIAEKQFSARGVTSYHKYLANFAYAEQVIESIVTDPTMDELASQSPAAESEEVVKVAEAQNETLPDAKTDRPTAIAVTNLPVNKTDESTSGEKALTKEDVANNFSDAGIQTGGYMAKMKKHFGMA